MGTRNVVSVSIGLVSLMVWYPGCETESGPRLSPRTIIKALYNYNACAVRLGASLDLVIGLRLRRSSIETTEERYGRET